MLECLSRKDAVLDFSQENMPVSCSHLLTDIAADRILQYLRELLDFLVYLLKLTLFTRLGQKMVYEVCRSGLLELMLLT